MEKMFKQENKRKSVVLNIGLTTNIEKKSSPNSHTLTSFASMKLRASSEAGFVDKWKEKYENMEMKKKLNLSLKKKA